MTWIDRLKPTINFTAPNGATFEAFWTGDSRSLEKSLGIFKYPKIKGAKVQDLDVGAVRYSIPFFFSGVDNDILSTKFLEAAKSTGTWQIIHPMKGVLTLQLISITESVEPINNGNIAAFVSEWIEPLSEGSVTTPSQIKFNVLNDISSNLNSTASDQFVNNTVQKKFADKNAISEFARIITSAVERKLFILYETSPEIKARITSIFRGIIDTLDQEIIDTEVLATQIQNIIQLPASTTDNAESRLSPYQSFLDEIFLTSPTKTTDDQRNIALLQELAAVSVLGVFSEVSVTSILETRTQAINLAEGISDKLIAITDFLDNNQELFINEDIDKQYFSQSESFSDSFSLISQGIAYLLKSIFDLLIEKRFVITKDRAPIEICITEYGNLGENDSNFDLFINSNFLKNTEILLLRAGKEVVVYV